MKITQPVIQDPSDSLTSNIQKEESCNREDDDSCRVVIYSNDEDSDADLKATPEVIEQHGLTRSGRRFNSIGLLGISEQELSILEPKTYKSAITGVDQDKWCRSRLKVN